MVCEMRQYPSCLLAERDAKDELIFASESNCNDNDELVFADETVQEFQLEPWKILIVDDESAVHTATTIALKKVVFDERPLAFISAYSAYEAQQIIQEHPDVCIILLDVIMETDTAGLDFVKYVREVLDNQIVRIVLRTGQPGHVPEKAVILNYDINDYKTKTELTTQKLFTTVLTALRSFSLSNKLQLEIQRREQVETALRESEQKEREKAIALEQSLTNLQQAQLQLVQSEKMSSLGQLVAGVAHEINNPVNFIYGNLSHAQEYITQLIEALDLYQQHYPHPVPEIDELIEEIDLPFVISDLPKLLSSMQLGAERIRHIVLSLRKFSRLDGTEMRPTDLHEGIDSTLMILHHRLKATSERPAIEVIKEYGDLPLVPCYAGQINQVFMNLLANAIDALEEVENPRNSPASTLQIRIRTQVLVDDSPSDISQTSLQETRSGSRLSISITDNGAGMSEKVRSSLFTSFFTTKAIGKGTGLGLCISRQILVDNHGGQLDCISLPGQGTQFIIELPIGTAETSAQPFQHDLRLSQA